MGEPGPTDLERRVLVLTPTARDAEATREILRSHGIAVAVCRDLPELCVEIGRGAGAAMVPEEAILADRGGRLARLLAGQPPWSDFPLVVLTPIGDPTRPAPALGAIGHVTLVRRPVHVAVLVSTIRSALRDRDRQYAARADLIRREEDGRRLRLALAAGRMAGWDCDLRTGAIAWSGPAVAIFGVEGDRPPATLGALLDRIRPDDRPGVSAAIDGAVRSSGDFRAEFRVGWPDGSERWIDARGQAFAGEGGGVVRLVGVGIDVTERRRGEEALREADRRKDEFLAMLAHELRNPLAAISNAVQVARRPGEPGQLSWATGVIEGHVRHLSRHIDDLLDVSRITRGKIALRSEPLDLAAIVRHAVETSRPLIEGRRHRLGVDIDPGPMPVWGDPTRLEQVFVNLLNNAAKYTEQGGAIAVSARPEGGDLAVRVVDNGLGIPPDQLPRMFELFAQGDRSMARSEGGLGIGLTLVSALVELHGGRIVARSEGPGTGSEFAVFLPRSAAPADGRPAERPAPGPVASASRVLVVDDNVDTARGMACLLEFSGHEVAVAHDGPSAIEVARDLHPRAILLDIGLPGMDGFEVARHLRRDPGCAGAVLIAVSGYGQEGDRRRSTEAGFDHHLIKPVDLDQVLALLPGDDARR